MALRATPVSSSLLPPTALTSWTLLCCVLDVSIARCVRDCSFTYLGGTNLESLSLIAVKAIVGDMPILQYSRRTAQYSSKGLNHLSTRHLFQAFRILLVVKQAQKFSNVVNSLINVATFFCE
jgi:hypothetical protein